jgi:hypothetical protein
MSKDYDPHYLIKEQAELDGWGKDATIDPEAFIRLQCWKACYAPVENRVAAIRAVDQAIGQDDGSSLRAKSQLFELRRSLSQLHEGLLKAKR